MVAKSIRLLWAGHGGDKECMQDFWGEIVWRVEKMLEE